MRPLTKVIRRHLNATATSPAGEFFRNLQKLPAELLVAVGIAYTQVQNPCHWRFLVKLGCDLEHQNAHNRRGLIFGHPNDFSLTVMEVFDFSAYMGS
jgi:hypothetical protein